MTLEIKPPGSSSGNFCDFKGGYFEMSATTVMRFENFCRWQSHSRCHFHCGSLAAIETTNHTGEAGENADGTCSPCEFTAPRLGTPDFGLSLFTVGKGLWLPAPRQVTVPRGPSPFRHAPRPTGQTPLLAGKTHGGGQVCSRDRAFTWRGIMRTALRVGVWVP